MFKKEGRDLKFLENGYFPVGLIARDSAIEMSFKSHPAYFTRCKELGLEWNATFFDPKIRSLHPWLARRPRSAARALNLGALLPSDFSKDEFIKTLGFSEENLKIALSRGYPPLISYLKPKSLGFDVVFMDAMAGGGSIPLEAASLGVKKVIAS